MGSNSWRRKAGERFLGAGSGGLGSHCFPGAAFLSGMMEGSWELTEVMIAQQYEYT